MAPGNTAAVLLRVVLSVAVLTGGLLLVLQADDSTSTGRPSRAAVEPRGDPRAVAERFGAIVEDQLHRGTTDLSEFDGVYCANDLEKARREDFKIATRPRPKATITVEDVRTAASTGTFTLVYANPSGKRADDAVKGDLVVEGGRWRVCNVFTPTPSSLDVSPSTGGAAGGSA